MKRLRERLTQNAMKSVAILAALIISSSWGNVSAQQTAISQSTRNDRDRYVEIPLHELTEIQQELQYLRQRDTERQAWEDSINQRLPETSFDYVSDGSPAGSAYASRMPIYRSGVELNCASASCSSQTCSGACGCYPCQCPLPPAPCIECPHVSTVSPNYNISVFGAAKLDMLFSGPRTVAPGTPFFLAPDSLLGLSQDTVSIHARQSTLGAALAGPQMGNFQSGGLIMAMFYNDAIIVDQYGFLPLQAYGELRNEDWRFAAGLQFDVFSPGAPTVLPFSALAGSGNSGNSFRGQVRVERFLYPAEEMQWTLQGALSEPIVTSIDPAFGRISEDNGWPNVEGRVALGLGPLVNVGTVSKRPVEFGLSGVVGQIRTTPLPPANRVVADVWGLAADFRMQANEFWGVMGEFYTGQGLGTYNAGVLQNINRDTLTATRTTGGWAEVFFYWTPCLHTHTGFGIDDPRDNDVAFTAASLGRVRNSTFYSNVLWDLNSSFRIGFEFAYRETAYRNPLNPDNEGAGFHTQFQWLF